jgi:hypothetical protein
MRFLKIGYNHQNVERLKLFFGEISLVTEGIRDGHEKFDINTVFLADRFYSFLAESQQNTETADDGQQKVIAMHNIRHFHI